MAVLKKYWNRIESILRERLGPLYERREKLREVCVPYKIQGSETPYYNKPEVAASERELVNIESRVIDLLKGE